MERLTEHGQDFEGQFCRECGCTLYGEPNGCNHPNGSCPSYCYFTTVAERLADYEKIGMEPEEIIQFLALFYHMAGLLQEKRDQAVLEKIKHLGGIAQPSQFTWDKPADNAGYVAEARYDTVLF